MKFAVDLKDKMIEEMVDDWVANASYDDIVTYARIKLKQYYNNLTDDSLMEDYKNYINGDNK
tara:strand:+ start:460 stop:645 length:186 start_codon:yes stop_codon:yes gene_type:complete